MLLSTVKIFIIKDEAKNDNTKINKMVKIYDVVGGDWMGWVSNGVRGGIHKGFSVTRGGGT